MTGKTITAALAVSCLAAPIAAQEPVRTIMPEDEQARAMLERFGFSEAVVHGDTVYLSGVVAGTRGGTLSEEEAYDNAWRYIASILERAGSSLDDILDITTYHTDLPAQIDLFAEVKHRHIIAPFPAWTAIDIDRLLPDSGLVEIKIVARVSDAEPEE
ncbi:Rid family hydrolase [Parasphingopyxis sp.]|uniref:Rid family hydrolase n=1 Tax=Parasphingopyxis sp. TaxID=1920299 RepID=UPI002632C598|nr:Rid family hydrolase [Parasphingopyxis sp.]